MLFVEQSYSWWGGGGGFFFFGGGGYTVLILAKSFAYYGHSGNLNLVNLVCSNSPQL